MIPQPAKAQAHVAREHPRESSRYGTATHMQRAHASRGRRGGSRDRPRQLRLARRLVRAARALQPPSGERLPRRALRCSAAPRLYRITMWPPQTTGSLAGSHARPLSVSPPHRSWSRTTTARLYKERSTSGDLPNCPSEKSRSCERPVHWRCFARTLSPHGRPVSRAGSEKVLATGHRFENKRQDSQPRGLVFSWKLERRSPAQCAPHC